MTVFEGLKELKEYPNWVVWNPQGENPKAPLNPYQPNIGAKANNKSTWGTFEQALSTGLDLGFEFGESPFTGIDIDNCIDNEGNLNALAREVIEELDSYTELSPSMKGLHIIIRLDKPLKEYGPRNKINIDGIAYEIYDTGRYFRLTDKPFEGKIRPVRDCTEILGPIYDRIWGQESKEESKPTIKPVLDVFERDSDLWARMFNAKNGDEIRRLYNGDISDYANDDSRADLALCSHLVFYKGNNPDEIDRLFKQSGLYREKWDRQDYRDRTIEKAIATSANVYTPPIKAESSNEKPVHTLASYLDTSFEGDISNFQRQTGLKTGFANMDKQIELYSGLYVLGAISSLGKTTFCTQIADNIAKTGRNVLYFSFEQTEFELASKGIARIIGLAEYEKLVAKQGNNEEIQGKDLKGPTAVQVRKGTYEKSAVGEYKAIGKHEYIFEMKFGATIEDLKTIIKANLDKKPVVFVDYLQVIQPCEEDKKKTTKEIIDKNVIALKKLSNENNLVIFLISSLNRQNYLAPIDFESFKESGIIEYTADVVWGLQLACMDNELFASDKKILKRKAIQLHKNRAPRHIELVTLKNRYGQAHSSYFFSYYSAHDFFIPVKYHADRIANISKEIEEKEEEGKPKRKRL